MFPIEQFLVLGGMLQVCALVDSVLSAPTHSNVSSILEKMLAGYDSRLRPSFGGKNRAVQTVI